MTNPSSSAAVRSAAPPLAAASAAIAQAARLLLPDLECGRRIDAGVLRAAMEAAFGSTDAAGAWDWKTAYDACEAATVLFLRKYGKVLLREAGFSGRRTFDAREDRGPAPHPHASLRGEPGAPAVLDTGPAWPRGLGRGGHHGGRSRAGTLGRHRATRHPRRDRRRFARAERAGGDARDAARPPLPGRHRNPLRRGADRRSSGCRDHAERRRDEPALLGDGECRSAHGGRGAAPYRFRFGAALPGRPSRRHHRSKLHAGQSGLARRFRPASRTRPCRLLRRYRWRRLCQARHHDRHPAHRHRQGTRCRSEGLSGLARNSSGAGKTACLGERACPAALAVRVPRRRFRPRTAGDVPNGPRLRDAPVLLSRNP